MGPGAAARLRRDLRPRHPRCRAADAEAVDDSLEVGRRGLEQLRGQLAGALEDGVSRATTALPPSCSDREPPVPPPLRTSAVSDWT